MTLPSRSPNEAPPRKPGAESATRDRHGLLAKHLAIGWWSLLFFLCVGVALEVLHGFKIIGYLGAEATMRRLMWRLGHAHGALLALVHIAFGLTAPVLWSTESLARGGHASLASRALLVALLLLPGGFFAAGAVLVDGEPNPAVLLVPLGAGFLFVGVALTARATGRRRPPSSHPSPGRGTSEPPMGAEGP